MASTDIEHALFVQLTSTSSATAVITQQGKRLYLDVADSTGARPYTVYQLISDPHDSLFYGVENSGRARVQFVSYSTSRFKARTVSRAVRTNINHYQGSMDGLTVYSCKCGYPAVRRDPEAIVYAARFDALIEYAGG